MKQLRSFFSDLISLTANMGFRDVVDILMLALLFYFLLHMIRQSRSQVALRGLMIVLGGTLVFYLVTALGELSAMRALLGRAWIVLVVLFLIVFQNEIKKGLTDYGRLPIFRALFHQDAAPIEEIIKAAARLAEKRVGALICLERRTPLRPYIETGTLMDAVVSVETLRTIFAMYTPLHDGAVIIRNNRIAAAGCLLPLSTQELPKDLGTRHRAAIGLTEETDAVVVVVSEETGIISIAHDGTISRPETPESLREKLRDLFEIDEEGDRGEAG